MTELAGIAGRASGRSDHQTPRWYVQKSEMLGGQVLAPHDTPIMSLDERDRRWDAIRQAMEQLRIDCLVLVGTNAHWGSGMANVRYLTQIGSHHGAEVLFPAEGDPIAFAGWPHASVPFHSMQHAGVWVPDIHPRVGLPSLAEDIREFTAGGRLGLVGYDGHLPGGFGGIQYGVVEEVRRLLPRHEIVDATTIFDGMRLRKSEEELEFLARAGAIARHRVARLVESARPGATEADVWAAMFDEQIRRGGEPQHFNMLSSGPTGDPGSIQHLLHGVESPQAPTSRALRPGDIVICEYHTQYGGYQAHTEFSVVLGKAPEALKRMHATCAWYVDNAARLFVPGRTLRSVLREVHQRFEDAGLDWVELGFHGHGLMSPEYPTAVYREEDVDRMRPGVLDTELELGMVFGTNADPHDPSWRRDIGVMFGDTVVVTDDGGRLLVDVPRDVLEI